MCMLEGGACASGYQRCWIPTMEFWCGCKKLNSVTSGRSNRYFNPAQHMIFFNPSNIKNLSLIWSILWHFGIPSFTTLVFWALFSKIQSLTVDSTMVAWQFVDWHVTVVYGVHVPDQSAAAWDFTLPVIAHTKTW